MNYIHSRDLLVAGHCTNPTLQFFDAISIWDKALLPVRVSCFVPEREGR